MLHYLFSSSGHVIELYENNLSFLQIRKELNMLRPHVKPGCNEWVEKNT
jgi:hypothetical protein